ncbi:uncharacterized protein At4g17910-like isoform X2 [Gossypium hirsutum]|uniref:Uncharacterized protein At4g17910-like isoform X2 n=1 Tax=Gossypium hirsutum TaxID=3635 RepID=A0ABM2ZDS8_GOSHI|nr:uncharacterized protein At4g17910-like isoform X2 [Gossypium hirsutum]
MDGVELSSKSLASCSQSAMMDLRVCSFVLMNAVTSRQARNIKSSMSWWKAAFKSATPLLLLGFARLASTLNLDYQVHVGEYGVNWNMEFNILALFSHQDELCFRNSNTLCVCMCVFFLCIKLHIESMFMY